MSFVRSLLTVGMGSILFCSLLQAQLPNRIQKENRHPGTTAWQLTNPADARQIEGYASLTSVPVGGNVSLFVNTADSTYTLTVFRMGWYGGKGGRKVLGPQLLTGVQQVTPAPDPSTGAFECHWTNPFTVHVPTSWVSGIYLVKLHGNASGKESYIIFTVRDSRKADLVFQQSVITYQAYNPWPGGPGGWVGASLYSFNTNPALRGLPGYKTETSAVNPDGSISYVVQAEAVSFSRPYRTDLIAAGDSFYSQTVSPYYGMGAGDFLHNIAPAAMDFDLVRWLEHEGYDVTYITDVDAEQDVQQLLRARGYISAGHDEYVSGQMKANIIQARDRGVGLGFFGANYIYWPVQLLAGSDGTPDRTISLAPANRCVIPDAGDPDPNDPGSYTVNASEINACSVNSDGTANGCAQGEACKYKVSNWNGHVDQNGVSESEQALTGGMWDVDNGGLVSPLDDIIVPADAPLDHWVFANTGLNVGDVIPGVIGTEYNKTSSDPSITPPGLQILLHTNAPNYGANPVYYYPHDWTMTIYQAGSGAWVFNAGTNAWSYGLDDYFTGLVTTDGANNGPPFRIQCGVPAFHPGLVSCRSAAVEQITRNVLNKFIGH